MEEAKGKGTVDNVEAAELACVEETTVGEAGAAATERLAQAAGPVQVTSTTSSPQTTGRPRSTRPSAEYRTPHCKG
jgi:hypothetical protein